MFKNGDIICFLGDSITASGLWMAEAYQQIGTSLDIKCYNCGVSGWRASMANELLYAHCLSKNPTKVVVMFGVNDIERICYADSYTKEDKGSVIKEAMEIHKQSMESIVKSCLDFGAEVILCTPVPYDETNDWETENFTCQKGLDECARFVYELAKKYQCHIVDFRRRLLPLIPSKKVISPDRVHPTPYGYHVMGQIFLSEMDIIDEVDFETPFVFEPWNKARYDVECPINLLDYVDYCVYFGVDKLHGWGQAQKLEETKKRYDEMPNKEDYTARAYKLFIDSSHIKERMINELVRLTVYPPKYNS